MPHIKTPYGNLWYPDSILLNKVDSQKMFIDNIKQIGVNHMNTLRLMQQPVASIDELKAIDTSDTNIYTTGKLVSTSIDTYSALFMFNRIDNYGEEIGEDEEMYIVRPTTGGGVWVMIASDAITFSINDIWDQVGIINGSLNDIFTMVDPENVDVWNTATTTYTNTGTGSGIVVDIEDIEVVDGFSIQVKLSSDIEEAATFTCNGVTAPIYTIDGKPIGKIAKSGAIIRLAYNADLTRWYLIGGGGSGGSANVYSVSFNPGDWVLNETTALFELKIPSSVHGVGGDILCDIYINTGDHYRQFNNMFNEIATFTDVDVLTNDIVISSNEQFDGKLSISGTTSMEEIPIAGVDATGMVSIGNGINVDSFGRISVEPVKSISNVYVSKSGKDTNDGMSEQSAKSTITAALSVANIIKTGGVRTVTVQVLDSGVYTENINIPSGINLYAPYATIIGRTDVNENNHIVTFARYPSSNGQTMVFKNGTGVSRVHSEIWDGRGISGDMTGSVIAMNTTANAIMFVSGKIMYCPQDGSGVIDNSLEFGHMHVNMDDIYLAGNNAVGIRAQGISSHIVAFVQHILKLSPTIIGDNGIVISGADSNIEITANEITATTAYQITAGKLSLNVPVITGTRTGTPIFDLTDKATKAQGIKADGALQKIGGALTGVVTAGGVQDLAVSQIRNISAGTTDLTAGTSPLPNGELYFVYE